MRALRPLRTITRFESLRSVVICFMEAVPLLGAVAGVLVVFLYLYAVAAVQMFTDVYHNICLGPDPLTGEVSCASMPGPYAIVDFIAVLLA